jgi:hypothetical protein
MNHMTAMNSVYTKKRATTPLLPVLYIFQGLLRSKLALGYRINRAASNLIS